MRAMILAAGRGQRLRPLTDETPKPLLEVGGRPLIVYHIEALVRAGMRELVINLGHLGGRLRQALGDGRAYGARIAYSDEGTPPLETGGGVVRALPLLGDAPFVVLNGDVWTDYPLGRLPARPEGLAHLVLVDNPPHHPGGDFALAHGRVRLEGEPRLTFSGLGVYRPELFGGRRPDRFPLGPVLAEAAARDALGGEHYRGTWLDVGAPERLRALDRWLRGGRDVPLGVSREVGSRDGD
ncbi:MAG: nucleotidyltransferase family protein [Gammaproteobacteria bacterium]|nr:nucleotidyltransferase family protein [Gammaproteobacteria bacterium]